MAVRDVEVMTTVNGEVTDIFVCTFDAGQPRFAVRQRFHGLRIGRVPVVIGERDERFEGGRGARRGDVLSIIEDRAAGRHEASLEPFGRAAEGNQAVGNLFGERAGLGALACHKTGTLIGRSGNQPSDARIWARPPSMSAMSPRSNALTCVICVRMLARLKGFLPIPARPVKPVPNPTIRRPGASCSIVAMAEACAIGWR